MWAKAVAGRVAEYSVSTAYLCPAPYVRETAHIVAGNLPTRPLPGFEMDVADFWKWQDGKPDIYVDEPHTVEIDSPFIMSLDEVRAKLEAAFIQLDEKHKRETVAVVSQRCLTIIMILHMLHMHNKHYHQIAQEDGALNLFEIRDGIPSALYINDTCHLHGLI